MEYYNDYSNPFDFTFNDEDHFQLTEQKIKQRLAQLPHLNPHPSSLNQQQLIQPSSQQQLIQQIPIQPASHLNHQQPSQQQLSRTSPAQASSVVAVPAASPAQASSVVAQASSIRPPKIHITNNLLFILLIVFVAICYAQFTYINDLKELIRLKFEIRN